MTRRECGRLFALLGGVALLGLACASTPQARPVRPAGELVELVGFSLRLPVGPVWRRKTAAREVIARRSEENMTRDGVVLTALVPPLLDDPLDHPYDVLALARRKTAVDPGKGLVDVLRHSERLVRHQGMDCAEIEYEIREFADPVLRIITTLRRGRDYICVHPADPRLVIDLRAAVRNVDGAISALEEREMRDFLDSVRPRDVSTTDDRSKD